MTYGSYQALKNDVVAQMYQLWLNDNLNNFFHRIDEKPK